MKRSALITLLCVFLAFTAAAEVSRTIFDRLPHLEDEFAYLYQARIFARGQTYIDTPQPLRAYWQPFLISDRGRRFGKYSPGWPLLLAVGAALELPWIVNAWLAMVTVALVYRLGREVFNPATGAVAALLTAASPGMLLLNGTLMAHTAALCFTTLFLYAVWRVDRNHRRHLPALHGRSIAWGILGGIALGIVLIIRPLTSVGIAAPFVIYFGLRVLWIGLRGAWRDSLIASLAALTISALLVGLAWPAFNWSVSGPPGESFPAYLVRFLRGDDDTNLYLRIWNYDRIGFGENHGRVKGGHTPAIGWRHAKQDLSCAARDLFGWSLPAKDGVTVGENACLVTSRGYSWLMLPVGLVLAIRRRWTWLLAAVPVGVVGAYIAYWIGGALYSARYYSEAMTAVALVSAVGITELARLADRVIPRLRYGLYAALALVTVYSLVIYTPARLDPLRGYGRISQTQIDLVNRLRLDPHSKVVVIVWGDHHWRDIASLMAVTSPSLDSDIVLARDPDKTNLDTLLKQWANREKLFYVDGTFSHDPPPDADTQ